MQWNPPRDMLALIGITWWVGFCQQAIDPKNLLNYQVCQKVFPGKIFSLHLKLNYPDPPGPSSFWKTNIPDNWSSIWNVLQYTVQTVQLGGFSVLGSFRWWFTFKMEAIVSPCFVLMALIVDDVGQLYSQFSTALPCCDFAIDLCLSGKSITARSLFVGLVASLSCCLENMLLEQREYLLLLLLWPFAVVFHVQVSC